MRLSPGACAWLACVLLWPWLAAAATFDPNLALASGRAAVGTTLGPHVLQDTAGRAVRLADLRGKPLVLSPVYTSCYHSCKVLTRYLAGMVSVARDAVGEDAFNVVTVGFDTVADTPERMRAYARTQGVDDPRWRFLSGDAETMAALTREIGFLYRDSPQGFDHLAQTVIVDARGRVYRQVYGDAFQPPALVEPLKELVFGERAAGNTFDGWINGLKFLCTVYDPSARSYRFDYSIFVGAAIGAICLGGIAWFLARAWREHARLDRGTSGSSP